MKFKKFYYTIAALLLAFILIFFLIQKNSKEFDRNRVALVDAVKGNYIFRGNNPFLLKDGKKDFAYIELTSAFNNLLNQQGHTPLSNYYLIDISLLDLDEYREITKEKDFFANNPNLGTTINTSTLSLSLLLSEHPLYSNFVTKAVIGNYNSWITSLLNQIHEIALRKTDKPVVIYIHCDAGRDRTGLIVAGYRMLFKDTTLPTVRSQNVTEVGRNSRALYDKAIASYCLHVQQFYNKSANFCN